MWNRWLQQSVFVDAGAYTTSPRVQAIERFVTDGLYPFLQDFGYQWRYSEEDITNKLLHLLFAYRQGQTIVMRDLQPQEDLFDQYTYLVDASAWDSFWQSWGNLEDFCEDGYASQFRYHIDYFAWNYLDLENSSITQAIYEEIEMKQELDEQTPGTEKSKGKNDPYLQDLQSESKMKYSY